MSRGQVRKSATLTTNDPRRARVVLTCGSRIRNPFRGGTPLIDFKNIDPAKPPQAQPLMLMPDVPEGKISPKIVGELPPGVEATVQEQKPGEMYLLTVKQSAPYPNGRFEHRITLETGVEQVPRQDVLVRGQAPQRFNVSPKSIFVTSSSPNDVEHGVNILPTGEHAFRIERVELPDSNLKARVLDAGSGQRVIVVVPGGFSPGDVRITAMLVSTDPDLAPIPLPIIFGDPRLATVEPAPAAPCGSSSH